MFAGDSYDLGKAGQQWVKAVAKLLVGAARVRCEGYSDTGASAKRAKAIGYRRAMAVCDALKAEGVDAPTGAVGIGSGNARGDNSTAAGRSRNRRVEIRVWF
jgi:outer membrane protein OmpA-like peptidoglycan-associated protein